MSEQLARPFNLERGLRTRRNFLQIAGVLGVAALGATAGKLAYPPVKEAVTAEVMKRFSVYEDFSSWPFYEAVGAHAINRARLDELLGSSEDIPVPLYSVDKKEQADQDTLAEYNLSLERDGPVFAEFGGLHGDGVALIILKAVIDHGEEFLVPILQNDLGTNPPPVAIQLGERKKGPHTLTLYKEHVTVPVSANKVSPRLSQGKAGTIRSFLDMYQPDFYLNDYSNVANNFPLRSRVVVCETAKGIAATYIKECTDEDPVFWFFGSTVEELQETMGRPTDFDWDEEVLFEKQTGRREKTNIEAVYHLRKELPLDSANREGTHMPLRIASPNNNVEVVTDPSILILPKFCPRPTPVTIDEMNVICYTTDRTSAQISLCENYHAGVFNPANPVDAAIARRYGWNVDKCIN